MTVELDAIVERLAAEATGGEGVEAYAELDHRDLVTAFQGEVERLTSASSSGVGVRVVSTAASATPTPPTSDEGPRVPGRGQGQPGGVRRGPGQRAPTPPPTRRWTACSTSARPRPTPSARSFPPSTWRPAPGLPTKVTQVESARYGDVVGEVAVASSIGVAGSFAVTHAWCFSVALATEDDQSQVGYAVDAARALDAEGLGGPRGRRPGRAHAGARPSPRPAPCRWCSTAWSPPASSGSCWPACRPRRCRSVAACSPTASASRSAPPASAWSTTAAWSPVRAALFDGEVLTRRTVLIDDGVLQCFLHNTATAARDGGATLADRQRPARVVQEHPRGVGQQPVPGAGDSTRPACWPGQPPRRYWGANPITGDFSVGVSGLLFRDGQLAEPVREATVAAQLLDILKGIEAVGSDLRFTTGRSVGRACSSAR